MSKERKRNPIQIKAVRGALRDIDMSTMTKSTGGVPSPPDWLSERAGLIFNQLIAKLLEMSVLSPNHSDALSLLASRMEEVEILTVVIEDGGRTYETKTRDGAVMHRPRPEVAQRNEAMRHAQSLLSDFGLNPTAMSKVNVSLPKEENPFAALSSGR